MLPLFLDANGYPITGDSMRIHAALIAVAKGEMDRAGVAALLRELTA
jgi:prophage maintenance system killer protein